MREICITRSGFCVLGEFYTCNIHQDDRQAEQKLNKLSKIIFYYINNCQYSDFPVFHTWAGLTGGFLAEFYTCNAHENDQHDKVTSDKYQKIILDSGKMRKN